jgi:two-component system CheB/CheR fusion protein
LNQTTDDLMNLLTSTTIPVVMVGSDLRIRRFTPPARRVMNLLPTDVGRPIRDLKTNVDVPDLEALIGEVIEQVQPQEREVRDRAGRWYLLRIYPYRTTDHKIDGAVVMLLDIDEIKRTQEQAREARDYARAIVETVHEPLVILNEELRVQTANNAFYRTFAVTPAGTQDRLLYELCDRQWDIPSLRRLLEEVLPQEKAFEDFEVQHIFPQIGEKTMLLNARGLYRADRPALILLAIEDITERKQAEQALKEADRRKDEFLAMLSHELRNPLTPIRNALEIVKRLDLKDQQLDWACAVLDGQLDNLTRIVDDLLDISRITGGKVNLHRKRLDLASVIERAVETNRPLIEARGQVLTIQLSPEPIPLEGDLARLSQVVSNLLNNAAKYANAGGQIDLSAGIEDDMAVIRVRDNGSGIAPELLPRVFDLFTQSDQSLDRAPGGLGIGLTLVKRLVELHGGRVEAYSAGSGQGSEFVVRLLPATEREAEPLPEALPVRATSGLKVLLVDDNTDTTESLALLLKMAGHEVRTAASGSAALKIAQSFLPNAIVLDIGLPRMNGYKIAQRLRAAPATAHALLIALTGYGQARDRRLAEASGFDHHLVKPVNLNELLAVLGAHAGTPGE